MGGTFIEYKGPFFLRELVTGDSSISDGLPVAVKTNCGLEDDDDDDDDGYK